MIKPVVNIGNSPDIVSQSTISQTIPAKQPWYYAVYTAWGEKMLLLTALFLPLKLSLVYVPLLPLLLLWYLNLLTGKIRLSLEKNALFRPLYVFVSILLLSAPFGIHPLASARSVIDFAFFATTALVVADLYKRSDPLAILFALVCGASISSLYSIMQATFPETLPNILLPRMSESGQLALILPVAAGMVLAQLLNQAKNSIAPTNPKTSQLPYQRALILIPGFLNFLLLLTLSFLDGFRIPRSQTAVLFIITVISLLGTLFAYIRLRQNRTMASIATAFLLMALVIPLISSTLILNLKRGPWIGVLISMCILLSFYARKLLIVLFTTTILILILIAPVRARLQQSEEHFFIRGGRNVIWTIGLELAAKYPLGIGYNNSPILRKFSPEIPSDLKHFHSNPLNILVEGGWLGLGAYLWWIFALLKHAYKERAPSSATILKFAIGCAILSWQIAGLVEYNFGDSEVVLVAFILIGVCHALSNRYRAVSTTS